MSQRIRDPTENAVKRSDDGVGFQDTNCTRTCDAMPGSLVRILVNTRIGFQVAFVAPLHFKAYGDSLRAFDLFPLHCEHLSFINFSDRSILMTHKSDINTVKRRRFVL